jgi:DNA-binding response OmpR family regulator
MPAPVLVAHDDKATRELAVAALIAAGLAAVGFHDPMVALDAVEDDSRVRVLVTRVDFGAGKLNGVALARMLKLKRPDVKILFLALPENRKHAEGMGEFLPMPLVLRLRVATRRMPDLSSNRNAIRPRCSGVVAC